MPHLRHIVWTDPDIERLRTHFGALPERSRDTARDLVEKFDQGRDFSDAQWCLVLNLVAEATAPTRPAAPPKVTNPDIEVLREYAGKSFNPGAATDLVDRFDRGFTLSEKQLGFVSKLAESARKQLPSPKGGVADLTPVAVQSPLVELLDKAVGLLEWPSLTVDGIKAYRLPNGKVRFKAHGTIIANLDRQGRLWNEPAMTPALLNVVQRMVTDPVGTAVVTGRLRVSCCFCGKRLDNVASKTAGYGPTCATNYGLPWGEIDPAAVTGTFSAEPVDDECPF